MHEKIDVQFSGSEKSKPSSDGRVWIGSVEGARSQTSWFLKERVETGQVSSDENQQLQPSEELELYRQLTELGGGNHDYRQTHIIAAVGYQLIQKGDTESYQFIFPVVEHTKMIDVVNEEEAVSFEEIEAVIFGMCKALAVLHCQLKRGHGDLTLNNVIKSADDQEMYLIDFSRMLPEGLRHKNATDFIRMVSRLFFNQDQYLELTMDATMEMAMSGQKPNDKESFDQRVDEKVREVLSERYPHSLVAKLSDFAQIVQNADSKTAEADYMNYAQQLAEEVKKALDSQSSK